MPNKTFNAEASNDLNYPFKQGVLLITNPRKQFYNFMGDKIGFIGVTFDNILK